MAELTSEATSPDNAFGTKSSPCTCKSEPLGNPSVAASPLNPCPHCGSKKLYRDGLRYLSDGSSIQRWLCRNCSYRFSEKPSQENLKWSINTSSALPSSRQICVTETKNLATTQETKTCVGEETLDVKGKLLQFAFYCQKEGMAKSTVLTFSHSMRRLAKIADINDPESIKEALAKLDVDENTKVTYCIAYTVFQRFQGKTWNPPKYTYRQKLPEFLPTEQEIDQLVSAAGPKLSTVLQLIKETGMRIGECLSLQWMCVNFENRVVTLTTAEKRSLPRVFKVSNALTLMLGKLPKQNQKLFGTMTRNTASNCLRTTRLRVAERVSNPRIAKIHFHLIRHWFGTMEYHKKPDMDHVRRLLGHKSILNTQLYVNMEKTLFSDSNDDYIVKVASNVDEASKLIEVGFEHVTEMDGKHLFRKRK